MKVHVREGSIRLFAPSHPGAFVLHLGELNFATVLTSDNPNVNCEVSVPSLSALMADDFASVTEQTASKDLRAYRGVKYWQVCQIMARLGCSIDVLSRNQSMHSSRRSSTPSSPSTVRPALPQNSM